MAPPLWMIPFEFCEDVHNSPGILVFWCREDLGKTLGLSVVDLSALRLLSHILCQVSDGRRHFVKISKDVTSDVSGFGFLKVVTL